MEYASLTNNQDDLQSKTVSEDFQPSSLSKITRTDADIYDNPPEPNSDVEDGNKSKAELAHTKKKYAKITNQKRLELIDSVENKGQNIKQAAQTLKLNYSSAKSIFQVFKKEGRSIKKTYKQRFVRQNGNPANLEIPNPPCDNNELKKLLLPSETLGAQDVQQKQENIEQKSTPIGSYFGNSNQNQSFSDITTPANSLTPIQSGNGLNKSPLNSDASQTQVQKVFIFPPNFQNNQNPQTGQNQAKDMQQGMQTRYEMKEMRTNSFNTMNTMTFVPPQQQQQQTYMVYQGNMQPMQPFMIMNSPQPVFQNNNFQGFNTFQRISQPPQQINEQNQKMFDFNEPAKIVMNSNQNQNQNIYLINNQNSNDPPSQRIQMNMYPSITPANQVQYYMPTSTAAYFVGGGGNNNNSNNNIQNNVYQQMQPMMFVQSQPNYYVQSITATDMYIPQQQGGFMIYGDLQNQGNQEIVYENKEDLMKAKKENL